MEEEILKEEILNEEEPISYTPDVIKYSVYARTDENNRVVKVFSDCFEQPQEEDILIKSGSGDEFVHVGYYQLLNNDFVHCYKIENGKMTECSIEDLEEERAFKQNKN
mgnify:CR=1 FL=1